MDQLSGIQNLASCNKNHSFCEVGNGQTTRFLEDAWKQEPKMENPDREELQQEMTAQGKTKIHHYWKKRIGNDDKLNAQNRDCIATLMKEVEEELRKRKIVVSEDKNN